MDYEILDILEKFFPNEIANMIIDIKENMEFMDNMVTCERCGNIWDGYAQCFPCIDSDSDSD